MDKIYMVRSYFEDTESSYWQIVGLYTDSDTAHRNSKKWGEFYEEKKYKIFNQPKNWLPTKEDLKYSDEWCDSLEYYDRVSKYRDIINFREIEIEEYDLNADMTLKNNLINENLLSLMKQWDRSHKLDEIIK